jgi:two-component system, NtrC family, nitrogen regulation sensor histidine kinase NtrY
MIRSFQFNIFIRIILIVLSSLAAGWLFSTGEPLHTGIIFVIILMYQVVNLTWYVNKINNKISYFFDAVKNEDFSLSFPEHKGDRVLENLHANMVGINRQIQKIHLENRRQEQYFGALIEHVGTGILTFDNQGFVVHANSSVKKLLGMKQFTHLRQLEKIDAGLAGSIRNAGHNDKKLITFGGRQGTITLLVRTSAFRNKEQLLTLMSMQDIKKELDEKELDSWLKLIRVLTHEIMNSIAPVTSLSENLCNYYIKDGETIPVGEVNDRMIQNTVRGLKVIHEQGQGLVRFVESYRKLTRLPKPDKSMVPVKELLEKTAMLCQSDLSGENIKLSIHMEDQNLQIEIDEKLISQVMLNLLKNSADALRNNPAGEIELSCKKNAKRQVEIDVKDNGPGIPAELIDEIFIPFFTTRENGNGIGLSLSRQIMKVHNGSLRVRSAPGRETVFTMVFNP